MAQKRSKKRTPPKNRKASKSVFEQGPWKRSWNVIWVFVSAVGEVILIFLVKGQVVSLSIIQEVVIFICIPIVVHLLVSGVRSILILIS